MAQTPKFGGLVVDPHLFRTSWGLCHRASETTVFGIPGTTATWSAPCASLEHHDSICACGVALLQVLADPQQQPVQFSTGGKGSALSHSPEPVPWEIKGLPHFQPS